MDANVTISNITDGVVSDGNSADDEVPFTLSCSVFTIAVDGVLLSALVLFSVLGNSLSLLTWHSISRLRGVSSTVIMLQWLAVSDTLLVLPLIFVTIVPLNLQLVHPENLYAQSYQPYMIAYVWPVSTTANCVTVWTTTLLTVHRFHVVCFPLSTLGHKQRVTGVRSTCVQLAVVLVLAVAYNVPRFMEVEITTTANSSYVDMNLSEMLMDPVYQIVYRNASYIVLMSVVPLFLTSVLTCKILQSLSRASRDRQQMAAAGGGGGGGSTNVAAAPGSTKINNGHNASLSKSTNRNNSPNASISNTNINNGPNTSISGRTNRNNNPWPTASSSGSPESNNRSNGAVASSTMQSGRCSSHKNTRNGTVTSSGRNTTRNSNSPSGGDQQRSISILLVTVIIVFIICQTPTAIVRILLAIKPTLIHCGSLLFYFQEICLLLVTLNSSCNIVVYAVCSADFRRTSRKILGAPFRGRKQVYRRVTTFSRTRGSVCAMDSYV